MRKINIANYEITTRNEKGEDVIIPYDVKNSMIEVLFARDLGLQGREILARDTLAQKINGADGSILLEENEWGKLVSAVETIKGLGRSDVELVHRVLEAKDVNVEEKK